MKLSIKIRNAVTHPRAIAAVATAAMVISLAAYPFCSRAHAAEPAPPAPPLSASSVRPLLALDQAVETVAARVTPAVVNVSVTSKKGGEESAPTPHGSNGPNGMQQFGPWFFNFGPFTPQRPRIQHDQGSGVIISPDGYIVTNNHVVAGAVNIRVTLHDRRILNAKLVGADPLTDLAVLKVNAGHLPSVPFGDSTKLQPGQSVLAFGNPLGFNFTVTRGIVSALNRPNPFANRRAPGLFIQTDAAINPGNSGGPLVNARGEVIGINTFLVSGTGSFSGMGFAIPSQIVQPTVESLIQYGRVRHGYIGIGISDVTPDEAKFFHVANASGAVITQVTAGAPGSKAGLKVGDVITKLDGKPVSNAGELQVMVEQKQPGSTVRLELLRNGKTKTIPVTLSEFHKKGSAEGSASEQGKPRWGLGLSDLTPALREQLQAGDEVHGAVIQQVTPGSPADDAGLQTGEVITEVNRHPVYSAADVKKRLDSIPKGGDALILLWSKQGSTFRVLHPPQQ